MPPSTNKKKSNKSSTTGCKLTRKGVLKHIFLACRYNEPSKLKKWLSHPLCSSSPPPTDGDGASDDTTLLINTPNDGIWTDEENHNGDSDLEGLTPLHVTCKYYGFETVKLLLEAGADPNLCAAAGQSVISFCTVFDNVPAMKIVLNHYENSKTPIDKKIDLEACTPDGFTPLLWAATNGNVNCLKLLIAAGANLHAMSEKGMTAVDYAHKWNEQEAILILLAAGAAPKKAWY